MRKQKTDRLDAALLLQLLLEDGFPRVWVPRAENRDLRQLLWHRHRLVQMRTRIMNQLQAVAMNEGVRRKQALWNKSGRAQLESLPLALWAARRRHDLLDLLDGLNPMIEELSATVEQGRVILRGETAVLFHLESPPAPVDTYVWLGLPSQDLRAGAADLPAQEKALTGEQCTFL